MTTSTFSPPTKLFIAGQWVDGPNKVTVRNKYTGEIAHELSGAGPDEVNRAVAAAKAAFPLMASMPIYKRADILRKAANMDATDSLAYANQWDSAYFASFEPQDIATLKRMNQIFKAAGTAKQDVPDSAFVAEPYIKSKQIK